MQNMDYGNGYYSLKYNGFHVVRAKIKTINFRCY